MPKRQNTAKTRIIPGHIGIIMDGNRRWAKRRGLPANAGHSAGADVFQKIVRHCEKIGVKALTIYAFSTENWVRMKDEVDSIMNLLRKYLNDAFGFKQDNIRITFIGDRERLDNDIITMMQEIEKTSNNRTGLQLNVAINYGGRQEIIRAAKILTSNVIDNTISLDAVDEEYFNYLMYTCDSPPLDIILRPSGEQRISNFLLWQCAYSEFIYMDTLWPDFTEKDLDTAIDTYNKRSRRYGGA